MIKDLLVNKNVKEKANIKAVEIAKLNHVGTYTDSKYGVTVEIQNLKVIDGGIEILAKAWKGVVQLGFGKDGSIEIERFKIYNPPTLIPDGTKQVKISDITGEEYEVDNFKEDLIEATRQTLAHIISLSGKESSRIVKNKIGNTTSTFYPAAGDVSPIDGRTIRGPLDEAFATIITGAGSSAGETTTAVTTGSFINASTTSNQWKYVVRFHSLFDTSAITDTDTIDSATYSIWVINKMTNTSVSYNVTATNPAATNALVASDHQTVSNTKFATDILTSNITNGQYTDWTFNSSGLAAINKTGISKFAFRVSEEISGSMPTWASGIQYGVNGFYTADQVGTTSDPKLVVMHSAPAGPANLKSYNTNLKANIKSINTNLIANAKSLDTNV